MVHVDAPDPRRARRGAGKARHQREDARRGDRRDEVTARSAAKSQALVVGSEPHDGLDTLDPWRRAMQGHAVSNVVSVIAANRVGEEKGLGAPQNFYGASFIADHRGDLVAQMGRTEEGFIKADFDLDFLETHRAGWGFFRDRRADLVS